MADEEAGGQAWELDSVSSEIFFSSCLTKWSFSYLFVGYPTAYPAAAPAYNPSLYPTNSPSYAPGKEKVEIVVVSGWEVGSVWKNRPTCWPLPVLNCFGLSLFKSDSPGSSLWELRQFSLCLGTGIKSPSFHLGLRLAHLSSAEMSETCILTEHFLLSQTMSKSMLCSVAPEAVSLKNRHPHPHNPIPMQTLWVWIWKSERLATRG